MVAAASVSLPLLRGTTEGANCNECPFSINGRAARPVCSEHPAEPAWILVGEGPGSTEVVLNRPFVGPSGEVVNKILAKIGRDRREIFVGNATLCQPPRGSPDHMRDLAAKACKPRLDQELAQWPGVPVLTLGAVAARALIPQETLDAIDPPTVPKSKKRSQKERQRAEARMLARDVRTRVKAIEKIAKRRLKDKIKAQRGLLIERCMAPLSDKPFQKRKKPTASQLDAMLEEERWIPKLKLVADREAITEYELGAKEREMAAEYAAAHPKPKKPPKPKKVKITDIMGTCFDVDVDGTGVVRPLIPALHPAALLRGGGATIGGTHTPDLAFVNLVYDAGKVNALAQGHDVRLKINIETEIVDEERTGQLLRDIVYEGIAEGMIAIDLETYVDDPERHHALMAYVARIKAIGLATSKRSVSILWSKTPAWAQTILAIVLAHREVTKTFHNGIYDRTVLTANGFLIDGPWEDTLLAHHAAFPGLAHRLQVVTSQFFATAPWKSEFRNAEETPEGLTVYNAKDTGATHALLPQLQFWVKKTKTEKIYALDKKMAEIASKMHLAGMPVSREINSELLKTFSKNVADSRRAVEHVAEDPKLHQKLLHYLALQQAQKRRKNDSEVLNDRYSQRLDEIKYDTKWKWKIGAGKHIAALLQALGVQLHQVTASGQISTKKDVLESLVNVPVIRDILTFRENDKLLTTFVWQMFDREDSSGNTIQYGYADESDRVHPIWVVHKITGRWASSEPVVSNVPKEKFKKLADGTKQSVRPNLRRQIVSPPGRIFVGFDFGQLEARVIALISGDPFLCQVFADGRDIHTECARVVFTGFDKLEKYEQKQARDVTKNFEYGAFYGGSTETLWKTVLKAGHNIKLVDVAKAVALLMNRMPGVVAWQRSSVAEACQPPYEIRDFLYGRRRTFPLGQVEATEAMNFGVQAAGASIMNTGMARMDDVLPEYKEAFAIVQVHDSCVFECWEDDADKLVADVKRCFEQEYERDGRRIPFSIEVKVGKTWADV
jgi:uracil-DNA glycosylase family 4